MEARIQRHHRMAEAVRSAITAVGLELLPQLDEYSSYSNTVTAIKMPNGIDDSTLRGTMRKRGILLAGGQSQLKGNIFRIATMGNNGPAEIMRVISELELVLHEKGVIKSYGAGVEAANKVLRA